MKKIAVIGAGMMGAQIAQLFSQAGGYQVSITDVKPEIVNNGLQFIRDNLKRFFVDKGKMTEADMSQITGRITGTADFPAAVGGADFVIEAAFENLEVKKNIFRQLEESAAPGAILASNSSYLSISEMGSVTGRRDKVVGVHFFNPVAVMKLVEVVRGPLTSDATAEAVIALVKQLGKEPVVCQDFSFGFLANRAYGTMELECIQMVWERVAAPEEIDKALKLGYNLPMGPLELGDFTGSWGLWALSEQDKMREVGPEKGHLHPLVRMMVRAGYPGGRGKKGIYDFYRDVLSKG
ncbi:MAG: 3-hydroxyacyl-CoA dehydrogenase family protein [Chloroflexota bacterium]